MRYLELELDMHSSTTKFGQGFRSLLIFYGSVPSILKLIQGYIFYQN